MKIPAFVLLALFGLPLSASDGVIFPASGNRIP